MKQITDNIWKAKGNWIVIPTNGYVNKLGECVMGRGLALQAKSRYPKLALELGTLIEMNGNHCFLLRPYHLISFPVKPVWWVKASLELIEHSTKELISLVNKSNEIGILLPLVGCGNGKLQREQVLPILNRYLDDRFTLVEL